MPGPVKVNTCKIWKGALLTLHNPISQIIELPAFNLAPICYKSVTGSVTSPYYTFYIEKFVLVSMEAH